MYDTVRCKWCGGSILRPVGEEEKHIWVHLKLGTGIWCENCRSTSEIEEKITFCSPECLEYFIKSDEFWRLKNKIKEQATKAAEKIRQQKE